MNIGFDAKRFFLNTTGLGNYSRSTVSLLHEFYPEHSYHLYSPRTGAPGTAVECLPDLVVHTPPPLLKSVGGLWRTALMTKDLRRDNLDIFHGLSHELPLGITRTKIRSVVTMHDLIFMRYPELYSRLDARLYAAKYRRSCRDADLVIAISEQTAKDLQEFFDIAKEKIRVVYQTCDPAFTRQAPDEELARIRAAWNLPDTFILYVGSLIERKNGLSLLQALSLLPDSSRVPLVMVGRGRAYKERLVRAACELGIDHLVSFLDRVPFQDLPGLYQLAGLFVYPSRFEGFGIPILEALCSNTPVITSIGSCFAEAGGEAALYTDPDSPEDLAAAMDRVLASADLQSAMRNRGKTHIKRFSGRAVADNLMQVYRELLA